MHAVVEARHLEIRARIAAGFFELPQNIPDGDDAKFLIGEQFGFQDFEYVGAAHQFCHGFGNVRHDFLHHRVGLGVNAGHVQRVVTAANAQKAGALLEGLGTQARHLHQLLAVVEGAMGLAPAHHRLGHAARQTRHARQQRHTGGVQVNPHRVHTILHHGLQRFGQLALIDVVLVLAHANRFGIDLHQLGQRVLQPPGNAGGSAQTHVHIGHFLRGKFAGGIDRSPGLADHHFFNQAV